MLFIVDAQWMLTLSCCWLYACLVLNNQYFPPHLCRSKMPLKIPAMDYDNAHFAKTNH